MNTSMLYRTQHIDTRGKENVQNPLTKINTRNINAILLSINNESCSQPLEKLVLLKQNFRGTKY